MIVKKINNLALDIQKTPNRYRLNIMKKNKDSDSWYVICGFDYDKEYYCYQLNACINRLDDKTLDWYDLGCLVNLGYKLLNGNKLLEDIYKELDLGEDKE